jgi:hypothetical protein
VARQRIVRPPSKLPGFWRLALVAGAMACPVCPLWQSPSASAASSGASALVEIAAATQPPASPPEADMPIYLMHRVVILNLPSSPQSNAAPVQKRIAVERVKLEQKRHRKRKRLFAPEPAVKPARRRPPILPPPAARKPKQAADSDLVPPDQRAAIAQALLVDALSDRLLDRLKVIVVPDAEVKAALAELHLTPQTAASREGALQLCQRLQAQAVVAPRVTAVALRDGVTRDCVVRAIIRIPGVQLANGASSERDRGATLADPVPSAPLPAQLVISGSAQIDRVLFGSQYVQSQSAAIRLAVQQAAALAVHAALTGQSAPFMSAGDRLALAPVSSPPQADRMLFTPQGRRVQRNAVQNLPQDVSYRLHSDLLPLLPEQILTPKQVCARLSGSNEQESSDIAAQIGRSLWSGADTLDVEQARSMAKRLGVGYILTAHITDIELEEGPPPSEAPAITSAPDLAATKTIVPRSLPDKSAPHAPPREREAKAEAVGALIRASDGVILWRAHASATMSATLTGLPRLTATHRGEQRIATDAVRFALTDLERQFMHYRATYEK